jgi:hypothetical protein
VTCENSKAKLGQVHRAHRLASERAAGRRQDGDKKQRTQRQTNCCRIQGYGRGIARKYLGKAHSEKLSNFGKTSREENMAIDESDLAARLMGDMDKRLLDFLKTQVNSFVKWDLVRFFHNNPNTADTAENVARYAGRDPAAIEQELVELAESGVLRCETIGEMTVYSLATDQEMRDLIDQFVLACDDRQFRVKAIYHIIRGMR